MRRFSTDLWTGIVCGYFFVFAFEGVIGLVRLFEIVASKDSSRAVLSLDSAVYVTGELFVNALDAFAGVQLMRRAGYANVFAKGVVFVHLMISTGVIYQQWQMVRLTTFLPVIYNLNQMVLAVLVFCILGYLRVSKDDRATSMN